MLLVMVSRPWSSSLPGHHPVRGNQRDSLEGICRRPAVGSPVSPSSTLADALTTVDLLLDVGPCTVDDAAHPEAPFERDESNSRGLASLSAKGRCMIDESFSTDRCPKLCGTVISMGGGTEGVRHKATTDEQRLSSKLAR